MKTTLILALALLSAAVPASAARWKPVSINAERAIFIDMDALARNGNVVQAWDWQKYSAAQSASSWQGNYFWVKSLTNYHCVRRTTDAVLKIYFGEDGAEVKRAHLEGLQFPAAVEPDSLREKMLETACNPPKPAVKLVAAEAKPAEPKATADAAEKADAAGKAGASKDDKAADKAKDEKKPEAKPADKAPAKPLVTALPPKPKSRIAPVVYHRTYTLPAVTRPKKKAGASKVAHAAPKTDPACPPHAAGKPQGDPPPQLTEAHGDGLFN